MTGMLHLIATAVVIVVVPGQVGLVCRRARIPAGCARIRFVAEFTLGTPSVIGASTELGATVAATCLMR